MLALCVDDEELLLADLVRAVELSPDITGTVAFHLCSEALEWAELNKPDIAFLDVRMRGMGGLELARKLNSIHPKLPIIFCTGYREYAYDAFKLHVSGYLLKPVDADDIQREIDNIKSNTFGQKLLKVRCFGNFEVFKDGQPLHFKRKRSKEVLAYLIDRRGSTVTTKEICAALWEDDDAYEKNTAHLYKLLGDLRSTLAQVGAEDVLVRNNYDYAIDTEKVDCDYYHFLVGDPEYSNLFCGEYMLQYSWAEETAGFLSR